MPAEHASEVCNLAGITGDQFAIDDIEQIDQPNGDVVLTFTYRGENYSFLVRGKGRWRNVADLLNGLNGILGKIGLSERFVQLYVGDGPAAIVTFVDPDKFVPIAKDLGIKLEAAPGSA